MSTAPMSMLTMATHCGCVRCQNHTGLRRRNSTKKRSTPESTRNQPNVHQPDLS